MENDFLDNFDLQKDVPLHIEEAAFKLSNNRDFKYFMKWWLGEQSSYANNLLSSDIDSNLVQKIWYFQGQKAEINLILHLINTLSKSYKNKQDGVRKEKAGKI